MDRSQHAADAPAETFLITKAETSLEDQHRARMRRYFIMMSLRIPALILAWLVFVVTDSGWWAIAVLAITIPIPWIAVLIANDRAPRKRGETPMYLYGGDYTALGQQQLSADAAPPPPTAPPVIDAVVDTSQPRGEQNS